MWGLEVLSGGETLEAPVNVPTLQEESLGAGRGREGLLEPAHLPSGAGRMRAGGGEGLSLLTP